MTEPGTADPAWADASPDEVDRMLGELGVAMLAAGYAVTDVGDVLGACARNAGRPAASVGALPTAVMVDDPAQARAHVAGMAPGTELSFDQTQRVGMIAADAAAAAISPATVLHRLHAAMELPQRYPTWGLVVGNALVAAGVSSVLRTSWFAVLLDLVLGALVGAVLAWAARIPRLMGVLPFALGLLSALLVFALAQWMDAGSAPLFAVFAPIVVLVPGATITNAVIELAAGDVVSGGGRLVSGLVTWAMLLLGVLVGASLAGVPANELADAPAGSLPAWAAWAGLVVMGVGIGLSTGASPRLTAVLIAVLLLTWAILVGVAPWTNRIVASGVAAAVMLVLTRLVEHRYRALPSIVTFRPAFWLLVPGSLGLAALTGFAGAEGAEPSTLFMTVLGTVLAISIGVQLGAVASAALIPSSGAGGRVPR